MTISEHTRHQLYEHFVDLIGEEATADMLSHFPPVDADQLATRDYIDARFAETNAELRSEMHQLEARLIRWTVTMMTTLTAIVFAVARFTA